MLWRPRSLLLLFALPALPGCGGDAEPYWVAPMRQVHARFTGTPGTFAHFGDSITVSEAFWGRLKHERSNMSPAMAEAYGLAKGYQLPECWDQWKGAAYGNDGSTTIQWAQTHLDEWLRRLNPEVVLLAFGTNDLVFMDVAEFEQKTCEVVSRCLDNGSVVILMTPPPRSRHFDKSRQFAGAIRRLAYDLRVPLVDFQGAILERRPDDWDGTLPQFKDIPGDDYQVPTFISRDGVHPSNPKVFNDYSELGLNNNGYLLRTYLTLFVYADVIRYVLQPSWFDRSELGRWVLTLLEVAATVAAAAGVVWMLEQALKRAGRVG